MGFATKEEGTRQNTSDKKFISYVTTLRVSLSLNNTSDRNACRRRHAFWLWLWLWLKGSAQARQEIRIGKTFPAACGTHWTAMVHDEDGSLVIKGEHHRVVNAPLLPPRHTLPRIASRSVPSTAGMGRWTFGYLGSGGTTSMCTSTANRHHWYCFSLLCTGRHFQPCYSALFK